MTLLLQKLRQLRARKGRQELKAFAALMATPGSLTTGVALPASATLRVATDAVLAGVTPLVQVGSRTLSASARAANVSHGLGWFERGKVFTKAAGATGVVKLYVQDDLGDLHLIASA